jgi:hypothetical protein
MVLRGGLGNQMFEYASAKAMTLRAGTDLVLNTSLGFVTDKVFKRQYCLDCFGTQSKGHRLLSFDIPGGAFWESLSRKVGFHVLAPWYKVVFYNQVDIRDLKEHPEKYKNVLMQGTWNRTDEFFDDRMDDVLDDMQLKWHLPDVIREYDEKIKKSSKPVVALGIRVYQDVIDKNNANERQRPPQVKYINDAMEWYQKKYGDVKFMVFTQVKQWFFDNVSTEKYDFEFVETGVNDKTAIFDMYLFSQCNHYILTHSTFYAWGEKLNRNNNKDVIIPENWSLSSKDNWIRL